MNKNRLTTLLVSSLILVFLSVSYGQTTDVVKTQKPKAKTEYEIMVEKVKQGDQTIDFAKLRAVYIVWVNDECNQSDAPERDKMVTAFEKKDWANAAERGTKVLDYEFANRGLHLAVADAYKELKNPQKENFHREIAKKLFEGLMKSGDGKSAKSAFQVHSIREEYQVMKELGYEVGMQALAFEKGYGAFDILTGKNKEGKSESFYFDINSFFGGGKSKPCKEV